jgi:hypothetical protein
MINLRVFVFDMPRKARIDAAGALHHIIVRGIGRRKIFWDDADRDSFVNWLGQVLIETHTDCFAWAIMANHVHLLMRTSLRFNTELGRVGFRQSVAWRAMILIGWLARWQPYLV